MTAPLLCGIRVPSPPDKPIRTIGIDLGTTNSTVAEMRWDPVIGTFSDVKCIPLDQETIQGRYTNTLLPSIVALYGNKTWIGQGAKLLRARVGVDLRENRDFFAETKNDMGLSRSYYGAPAGFGNAKAIAAELLRFMSNAAAAECDLNISNIVVTVPASFQVAQRQDTVDASQRAGIDLESGALLDEPIAAFLDLLYGKGTTACGLPLAPGDVKTLLVFDFGGGTCDVAVFRLRMTEVADFAVEPLSVSRYHRLGGGDIDRAIVHDVLLPQLVAQNRLDVAELTFEDKRQVIQPALLSVAESLKEKLSMETVRLRKLGRYHDAKSSLIQTVPGTYTVDLPGKRLTLTAPTLTAGAFESVLQPFLDHDLLLPREDEYRMSCSIFAPIGDALDRSGKSADDVDLCLLAGGSSLIPEVQDAIRGTFRRAELLTFDSSEAAQTSIARGAAIHAMALTVLGRPIITPVCHDDISLQTQGAPLVLIPRGQKLPFPVTGYARNEGLSCPKTQQSGTVPIRISLVAGKEQRQLFNELWEVPAPITQGTRLWLEYRFDENQCLEVRLGRVGQEDAGFRGVLENPLTHVVNPNKTKIEIEELEELLRSGQIPKDEAGDALQRLGNLYRSLGQRDKALAFFSRALKTYGEPDVYLLNKMAMCAREQGNKRTAEKFYGEAARISPWSGTFFNWALAKETWNELDQALGLAAKAHGLEEDPAYLVLEARLESKLGNQARADSLLTEALSRYGPPAKLDDFGLTWLRIAARMAGTSNKVDEVDRIMRERRLLSNVPNTQVGLLLDREDRDDSGQERRSAEWAG